MNAAVCIQLLVAFAGVVTIVTRVQTKSLYVVVSEKVV